VILQQRQWDMVIIHPDVKHGMDDFASGKWTDILDEQKATDYEIGRLLAAGIKSGAVRFIKGTFPKVEIDAFDVYRGSDYHARIGHHIETQSPPKEETY